MSLDDVLNNLFNNDIAKEILTWQEKKIAYFVNQGTKAALKESALSPFMLKRQIFTNNGNTYIGFAEPGTETNTANWFISRIDSSGNQLHADGNTNFDNILDDYLSLSYS